MSPFWMHAQSLERTVIGSAGFAVQNTNAGLSLTAGEVAIQSANLLTQGFQQPTKPDNVGIINLPTIDALAKVYPNPTIDFLQIKSNLFELGIEQLEYTIIDITGKIVLKGSIKSNGAMINVVSLASASYILVLSNGSAFNQKVKFTRI